MENVSVLFFLPIENREEKGKKICKGIEFFLDNEQVCTGGSFVEITLENFGDATRRIKRFIPTHQTDVVNQLNLFVECVPFLKFKTFCRKNNKEVTLATPYTLSVVEITLGYYEKCTGGFIFHEVVEDCCDFDGVNLKKITRTQKVEMSVEDIINDVHYSLIADFLNRGTEPKRYKVNDLNFAAFPLSLKSSTVAAEVYEIVDGAHKFKKLISLSQFKGLK